MISKAIHPFLLAIYLVLFVLAENLGEAFVLDTLPSIAVVLCLSGILFVAAYALTRRREAAATLTTAALALFFSHGALREFATAMGPISGKLLIVLELLAYIALVMTLLRYVSNWAVVTQMLNVSIGVLLLMVLFRLVNYSLSNDGALIAAPAKSYANKTDVVLNKQPEQLPDIYYIILDAYARDDALQEFYGYDNSDFTSFLTQNNFYLPPRSRANYTHTRSAVPVILNFDYESADADGSQQDAVSVDTLDSLTFNNRLVPALAELGYEAINILSGHRYVEIGAAEVIDSELNKWVPNEFELALLDMTVLPGILTATNKAFPALGIASDRRERLLYALDQLEQLPQRSGAKFVFAHIEAPHDPFVFGRNGEERNISLRYYRNYSDDEMKLYRDSYVDQLHYINARMKQIINTILEKSSTPPVIVLQGDHGLRLSINQDIPAMCFRENFANFTALHLPDVDMATRIPDTFSPVNTFRLILNQYFGTEYPLLPDRAWVAELDWGKFHFTEVTDQAEECTDEWLEKSARAIQ